MTLKGDKEQVKSLIKLRFIQFLKVIQYQYVIIVTTVPITWLMEMIKSKIVCAEINVFV